MSNGDAELRLLVKMKPGAPSARLRMDGAKFRFVAEPLFKSIGTAQTRRAVAPAPSWHVLKSTAEAGAANASEVANPWDICHQLLSDGLGIAGSDPIEFAEPDLQQQWLVGRPGAIAVGLAAAPPGPHPQNP